MSSLDLKKSDDDTVTNRYKNATTWMNFKNMPSKRRLTQKTKYSIIPFTWNATLSMRDNQNDACLGKGRTLRDGIIEKGVGKICDVLYILREIWLTQVHAW
jgi:hypothetical protein